MSEIPGTDPATVGITPPPRSILGWAAGFVRSTLMNSRHGVRDTLVSMAPQAVAVVTGVGSTVLIARGLGAEGVGLLAIIQSLSGLAMALTDLGIGSTAVRYAARAAASGDRKAEFGVLRWAFRLRMGVTFLVTAVFCLVGPLALRLIWNTQGVGWLLFVALLGGIFMALSHVPTIYFQARHKFGTTAVIGVLQNLILFGGICYVAVSRAWTVGAVLWATTIAAAMSALLFIIVVPKKALWQSGAATSRRLRNFLLCPWEPGAEGEESVHSFAWYYFLSALAVMITTRLDVWLLGALQPKAALGVYSVATRFTLPLAMLLGAMNTALWPRASVQKDRTAVVALLKRTFKVSCLAAGGALVYSIAAPLVAPLLFGTQYEHATILGQLLCIRYCIAICTCPIGIVGYSFGLVKSYWWINVVQLAAGVALDIALIPQIGGAGAAITLVLTDLLGFVLSGRILWRRVKSAAVPSASSLGPRFSAEQP
jgi:O-antigen/teichoic acid export membrane protein